MLMKFRVNSSKCANIALLAFISLIFACTNHSSNSPSTVGTYSKNPLTKENTEKLFSDIELTQSLGCGEFSESCEKIEKITHVGSNLVNLKLSNGNLVSIRNYTDEANLLMDIEYGKLDAAFGITNWVDSSEITRKHPHLKLNSSSLSQNFYLYSNFNIPDVDVLKETLIKKVFWNNLYLEKISTTTLPHKGLDSYITSIDMSNSLNLIARTIKLSTRLKDLNSSLYVESEKEFLERLSQEEQNPKRFIRISSTSKPSKIGKTEVFKLEIKNPIIISKKFQRSLSRE
jgi:hypothetical protein